MEVSDRLALYPFTSKEGITLQDNGLNFILQSAPYFGGRGGGSWFKFQPIISSKIFHDSSQSLLENSWTLAMIQLRPFISTSFPVRYFVTILLLGT